MNYFQDFETKAVKAKYNFWKRKQAKAFNTISVFIFYETGLFTEKFSRTGTIHPGIFRGQKLSIRAFSADGHYLNNREFLSRNYRLIVAPRKFDADMLVLRTSNFQGSFIRPIVPRHKYSIVFIAHHQNFLPRASSKISWIIFNVLRWKPWKQMQIF